MNEPKAIHVDVWSDVACPWCYIGKRHLEQGIERFRAGDPDHADIPIEIEFHSYELSPDTPVDFEGSEIEFLARHKGIDEDRAQQMLSRVTGIAADAGLDYDFAALQHTNTGKAHQVLHLAKAQGRQAELKERLLAAYFEEGGHVGRDADLADLAAEVGLDRDEVLAALADGRFIEAVAADKDAGAALGLHGVPFFVFDGKYAVSGAQPADVFVEVLTEVVTNA